MGEISTNDNKPGWRYFLQEKILVIFFLGFSSGLPLWLVFFTLTAWLYEAELPTSTISKFAFVMFAYSFKFIWSPLVDAVRVPLLTGWLGRRRGWLLVAQLGLAVSLAVLSQVDPGKTTTLYSTLRYLAGPEINITTVEDPIEMIDPRFCQVQVNPQIDVTFASALRSILRQDPDIIMVGEIRDRETANMAVQAALTGHLVFSTVHTRNAAGAITPHIFDVWIW